MVNLAVSSRQLALEYGPWFLTAVGAFVCGKSLTLLFRPSVRATARWGRYGSGPPLSRFGAFSWAMVGFGIVVLGVATALNIRALQYPGFFYMPVALAVVFFAAWRDGAV